jgi:hypothetical protein
MSMATRMLRSATVIVLLFLLVAPGLAQMRSGKFGVGVAGTASLLQCDVKNTKMGYGGGLSLSYSMTEYLGVRSTFLFDQMTYPSFGAFSFAAGTEIPVNVVSANIGLSLDMMPNSTINPFITAGVGRALLASKEIPSTFDMHFYGGGGFDIFLSEFLSVTVSGEYVMTGSDLYDGVKAGSANDSYARIGLQVRYYFFDQDFITKLLEALKNRYKGGS